MSERSAESAPEINPVCLVQLLLLVGAAQWSRCPPCCVWLCFHSPIGFKR